MAQTIISAAALAVFAVPMVRGLRAYVTDHRAYQHRLEAACQPAVVRQSDREWRDWLDGLLTQAGVRIVREDTSWQDTEAAGWPVRSGASYQAFGPLAHVVTGWRWMLRRAIFGQWQLWPGHPWHRRNWRGWRPMVARLAPHRTAADYRAWQREMWALHARKQEIIVIAAQDTEPTLCPLLLDVDVVRAWRIQRWTEVVRDAHLFHA